LHLNKIIKGAYMNLKTIEGHNLNNFTLYHFDELLEIFFENYLEKPIFNKVLKEIELRLENSSLEELDDLLENQAFTYNEKVYGIISNEIDKKRYEIKEEITYDKTFNLRSGYWYQ
jgi:hypothetical protein